MPMHSNASSKQTRGVYPLILEKCPHLFAAMPVFVLRLHLDRMAEIVRAAQTVIALPAYRDSVLGWAPPVAHFNAGGARGVFLSFDFHVAGASLMVILVGVTRIYLGVHYFSDVVAAAAWSTAWLVMWLVAVDALRRARQRPQAN